MFCCPVAKLCPDSSWPHGLRHSRLPCPSPSPGVCHIHVRCTSDAVQLTHLLVPSSPLSSIFPSIRVFSNELDVHIRWPKYWSFSFSISLSKEYSGLISLKIDQFDLAVQGTFRSLLQQHSSKASFLWWSAFFMVQLSQSCVTTGKTEALT